MYKAEVVADSISPKGHRICTMKVVMPRCILAEFNTHRMFSRNSASSRAIPLQKMLQAVKENPFMPLKWMKNHSGMQGTQYFGEKETFISTNPFDPNAPGEEGIRKNEEGRWVGPGGAVDIITHLKEKWLWLRDMAVQEAEMLNDSGVLYHPNGDTSKLTGKGTGLTKQMCNRLLESWMWHTVLVTATEWENFFALRVDPAAEIHMQHVAELMLEAMNASTPKALKAGEWHIPYRDQLDEELLKKAVINCNIIGREQTTGQVMEALEYTSILVAVALHAGVSYTVVGEDGKPTPYEKLIARHDMLLNAGHMSAFEHVARCMNNSEYERYQAGPGKQRGWLGNFRGWIQYRKLLPNENRSDNRLIKHV